MPTILRTAFAVFVAISLLPPETRSQSAAQQTSGKRDSQFNVNFESGGIVSLKPARSSRDTEFISAGRRLGDVSVRYKSGNGEWQSASTASNTNRSFLLSVDGHTQTATYQISSGPAVSFTVQTRFTVQSDSIVWNINLQNVGDQPVKIGDLSLPLPISRSSAPTNGTVILKHSFLSGHGSFLFWMRSDSVPPFLTVVPSGDTHLEYWETQGGPGGGGRSYSAFIHSAAAGAEAKERGTNWRQPHTSLTLSPKGKRGDSKTYSFKILWADGYDHVRQILVDEGGIDTQVVPGMTVPTDLFAKFALRSKQRINTVEAEYPKTTEIKSLDRKGDYRLYQVRFSKLGENRLTVRYGNNRHMHLEFFSTEPLETLVKKRAAFLACSQHLDTNKWYNGLFTDWNMETGKLISPDDYAPIPRNRYYAVTCDDPGLGKPAYLAAKNAEFPVQSEITALDYYITHFVWGGLQQTTNEPNPYGVYGIPDWKTNRESTDPGRNGQRHLWRVYDYPHVVLMYFGMYRAAKNNPQIKTELPAKEYLQRAYGTAHAMFTVPMEIERWSAYRTGFYNELVIVDLIAELEATGMKTEADTLRGFWERKVNTFVSGRVDLFRSEYAFDSTGFESTHALARYAMQHADQLGETNSGIPLANAQRFMETQMAANLFCRGWLEPAYYYLGSDYRGGGGNAYTLTYMSQMGGWGVLDYALNFATNPAPYLRLGYASYLSAWALMNTGTPESNYGYWYPGKKNDGGAGGGFEPAPFGRTWLGQPHHRGSWYFACEIDLGFCGALRSAATILADDPIFGRFCFGGDWRKTKNGIEVVPKDGLRRRLHARLNTGEVLMVLDTDRFAVTTPIVLKEDLSEIRFQLESDNAMDHITKLHLSGLFPGKYVIRDGREVIDSVEMRDERENGVNLPMNSGKRSSSFTISRER